jgi:putative membrane protein
MEIFKSFIRVSFLVMLLGTLSVGCERSGQNVQAARENASSNDHGVNAKALREPDKRFIIETEQHNIKERSLGRVVVQKSTNSDVKEYAQMLVDDHTKALNDLVKLVENVGMNQPAGLPEVKDEAQDRLNGLSGPTFDREYINLMVKDYEQAISKFKSQETAAQDQSVRDYAKHILPVLQKHVNKAPELQGKLNK